MTIEELAREYAAARNDISGKVMDLELEIARLRELHLPGIKAAVATAAQHQEELRSAIDADRGLFDKPRTKIFHGIKVGIMKQRGRVEFQDPAKTIARIRELLPTDQVELLIRRTESVHKPAVYDLAVADLKRLGITVEDDVDAVMIKPVDTQVDKLVDALLKEAQDETYQKAS